jgi:DNA repair protein RadA/Sms
MPRPKGKVAYVCGDCGNESPKWAGRCPSCGEWNTIAEFQVDGRNGGNTRRAGAPASVAQSLSEVSTERLPRLRVRSDEVNRVLGGGLVPGSLTLLAGEPGIGKSTLLLRIAADASLSSGKTLYVSGEESAAQVKMRADRLGISGEDVYLLPATGLDDVLHSLEEHSPAVAVIDSIQTVYDEGVASEAGSLAQIKECTRRLTEWAKVHDTSMILSGHVTKGGDIAGPRVLEHMVDVVLYMEGDPISSWRLLRTVKNRFGSTNEVGIFEMTEKGLTDVTDPSKAFLSERRDGAIGSVVVSTLEGSRPLLVEVQALTSPSALPTPRRVATGLDFNRLLLICAVLTRRAGLSLSNQDIVVNVTGGLKVGEPAADLGVALAIASSCHNVPVDAGVAVIGEVGLTGEVRSVPQIDRRVSEVSRLGLNRCILPDVAGRSLAQYEGMETVPVRSVAEAVNACIPRGQRRRNRAETPTP